MLFIDEKEENLTETVVVVVLYTFIFGIKTSTKCFFFLFFGVMSLMLMYTLYSLVLLNFTTSQ